MISKQCNHKIVNKTILIGYSLQISNPEKSYAIKLPKEISLIKSLAEMITSCIKLVLYSLSYGFNLLVISEHWETPHNN